MEELEYLAEKYNLNLNQRHMPIEIPNTGRDILAGLFKELGYTVGVEIGVERGLYTEVLCRMNPESKVYAVDAWECYPDYRDHVSQETLDEFYEYAARRVSQYNCELIKGFSMDIVQQFDDESLDWVYIDANHEFLPVANDIFYWAKKIRKGGIVSGHDYRKNKVLESRNHVVSVVNAYTDAFQVRPWFLLGTKDKKPGEIRDNARSWFWVKDHA
jgi:hypothetical protein